MAYLINRNPAARIECLHALVRFIYNTFGSYDSFSLTSVKFRREESNIHRFCSMLISSPLGIKYCPYKKNPLDEAGCSLTNGKNEDTTKSKEVSNTVNALHALGFVTRTDRKVKITSLGIRFAKTEYLAKEMHEIIKEAVLNYGPIIGVLQEILDVEKEGVFDTKDIKVGYPNSSEKVRYKDMNVIISTGSQSDSNTRTRSCLLAWLTTAGFIRPINQGKLHSDDMAHIVYRDFINQSSRNERKYKIIEKPTFLEDKLFTTYRPLDYTNLTKLTSALRENNMDEVREATMQFESRINNRRFAILYLLNKAFNQKTFLKISTLLKIFENNPNEFVITNTDLLSIILKEINIASMAGIPFSFIDNNQDIFLKPLTQINLEELSIGAPKKLIEILESEKI